MDEPVAPAPVAWVVVDPATGNIGIGSQPGVNPVFVFLKALEIIEGNRQEVVNKAPRIHRASGPLPPEKR